jgi:hypothetical protein
MLAVDEYERRGGSYNLRILWSFSEEPPPFANVRRKNWSPELRDDQGMSVREGHIEPRYW